MEVVISPNTLLPKKMHFIHGIVSVLASSLDGGRSVLFFLCLGVLYWLLPSLTRASSLYLHKFFQFPKKSRRSLALFVLNKENFAGVDERIIIFSLLHLLIKHDGL